MSAVETLAEAGQQGDAPYPVIPAKAGTHLRRIDPSRGQEMGPRLRGDDGTGWLRPTLLLIAAVAILAPALLVHLAPPTPRMLAARAARRLPPRTVIPAAVLPPVEPVDLVDLSPDEARAYNASVPFVDGPVPPAAPFRFAGTPDDLDRARNCLATAELYEAGPDPLGWKAVAQVIVNRVRHPAFPKTVCGVVFQGSERRTGCQFSFTCDGATDRWKPLPDSWAGARLIAAQALGGAVFRPVGLATHYHTETVVPYWQSSLDKVAAVGPHLFFRWTGWWGTPPAFGRRLAGPEPVLATMTALLAAMTQATPAGAADTAMAFAPVKGDPDSFLVTLPADLTPDDYPALAARACSERPRCRLSAWTAAADTPTALPLASTAIAAMAFSYLRDKGAGIDKPLWNCARTPRANKAECIKVQAPVLAPAVTPAPEPLRGDIDGLRRRLEPAPANTITPATPD